MIPLQRGDLVTLCRGVQLIVEHDVVVDESGWYMGDAGGWHEPFHISQVHMLKRPMPQGQMLVVESGHVKYARSHLAYDEWVAFYTAEHELDGMLT